MKDTRDYNFNEQATIGADGTSCVTIGGRSYGRVNLTTPLQFYHHAAAREYVARGARVEDGLRGTSASASEADKWLLSRLYLRPTAQCYRAPTPAWHGHRHR